MPEPIIPSSSSNPAMTGHITRRVIGAINRAEKQIRKRVVDLFEAIQRERVDADTGLKVNSTLSDDHWFHSNQNIAYQYLLSAESLQQISAEIDIILRQAYLGTDLPSPLSNWYMYTAIDSAYEHGTSAAVTNLSTISDDYNRSLLQVITSPAYANRSALLRARVLENMKGLTDSVKADLADTLARGMQAGQGPREIAKTIRMRTMVSRSRAIRIARTEINTAHRRARRDEARDAQDRLGIKTKLLHISALSPSTRRTHADRNGNTYTIQEVEDWYSVDGNGINCKCSQTEVLVGDDGELINKKVQERLKAKGDAFFRSHPENR